VVLAEKLIKFTNMNLKDLEKQLQEIQNMDKNNLTLEQFQEIVDKLSFIAETGEQMLSNEIKTQIIKTEYNENNNS